MGNILVTGGLGFIGSHVCDRLVENGHRVAALDNMLLGRRANVAHLENAGCFSVVEGDAADPALLDALFSRSSFSAVFHFAANSDIARSHGDPRIDRDHSFLTSFALLDAMRRHGVGQIVFASTSAIYGELEGAIAEDRGPLLPISHYGAAKLASEGFIASYGENYGIQGWINRFPNVVGDRATHGAVHDFVAKLRRTPNRLEVLGNGQQTKPYLHVSDLVDAIFLSWERMTDRTNVINIAGPTRCSVGRMAEIVIEESGRAAQIEYTGGDRGWVGDVPSVAYDTSRIEALGWRPRLSSEDAIRQAARWAWSRQP